jgi:hypothetical protein
MKCYFQPAISHQATPSMMQTLLEGDLNARHPFWNSIVSNPSCAIVQNLLYMNESEISAPQWPNPCSPTGNSDVLDIVVHKNVRLSEVIVSEMLESDLISIVFRFLDHVRTIFRTRLTNSRTGSGFRAWPLNWIHLESKLTPGKKPIKRPATLRPL